MTGPENKDKAVDDNKGLEWLEGDSKMLKSIRKIFVRNVPMQMEKLREAFASNDISNVELFSHSIKGAAAMIGAVPLRDEANKVELAAVTKNMDDARTFFENMDREFKKAIAALTGPDAA